MAEDGLVLASMTLEDGLQRPMPSAKQVATSDGDPALIEEDGGGLSDFDDGEALDLEGEDEIMARLEALRSELGSSDPHVAEPVPGEEVDVDDVLLVDRNLPSDWVDDEEACTGAAMLEGVAQLQRVHLDRERLTTLKGLLTTRLDFSLVTHLYLQTNFIRSLEPLAPLSNLVFLAAMDNRLADIRCLKANHPRLLFFDGEGNNISAAVPERDIPAEIRQLNLRRNPCCGTGDGVDAWRESFRSALPALEVLNREPLGEGDMAPPQTTSEMDVLPTDMAQGNAASALTAESDEEDAANMASDISDEMASDIERITRAMAAVSSSGASPDTVKAAVEAVAEGQRRLDEFRQTVHLRSEARLNEFRAMNEMNKDGESRHAAVPSPVEQIHKQGATLQRQFAAFRERELSEGLLQKAAGTARAPTSRKDSTIQDVEVEEEYEAEELA